MRRILFLLLIATLLPLSALAATTRYVDPVNGLDSRSCMVSETSTTPKQNLNGVSGAIACMGSGDTLILKNGTYASGCPQNNIPGGIDVAHPTILVAENARQATITGENRTFGAPYCVQIQDRNFITIDGINVNGGDGMTGSYNYVCYGTSTYCTFQNGSSYNGAYIYGSGVVLGDGSETPGFSRHAIVRNMEIYNNGIVFGGCTPANDPCAHGIYVNTSDNLVENNDVHNNVNYGIQISSDGGIDPSNNIIRNNKFYQNYHAGAVNNSGANNVWYGNLFYDNHDPSSRFPGYGFYISGISHTTQIYFNTIYGNASTCIFGDADADAIIRDNICYLNSGAINTSGAGGTVTCNHNLGVTGDTSSNLCGPSNSGTNPLFTAAGTSGTADFTLASTASPAWETGVTIGGITTDFAGNLRDTTPGPSVGAYEFVNAAPGTPPVEAFSYTTSAALQGNNGGTGFTAPWAQGGGSTVDYTVVTAPAGTPTGNAAEITNAGGAMTAYETRPFTGINTGPVVWRTKVTNCSPSSGGMYFTLSDAAGSDLLSMKISGGQFQVFSNAAGAYINVAACTTALTKLAFAFDDSGHPDQYLLQVDNGTQSAYVTVAGGSYSSIGYLKLLDTNPDAHTYDVAAIGVNPDYLTFSQQPSAVVSGVGMAPSPQITVKAPGNTTDTTFVGTVTLTISACGATISSGGTANAVAGVATFGSLILSTAASGCTLTASATNVDSSPASSSFNVTAASSGTATGIGRTRRK